ncbi:hypothetical protein CCMSSC00406_0009692 [Pleurotus cornucopiae]|uniref:Uncharacterized protein n=1 Tax=Pleurotus cornucopiae TaxID=5321 RepID=A0ACB7IZ77_PLECO|nr:hypothetical protein CCMSSC00406_0009692 [Pleurotus cornucopiae]
MFWPPPSLEVAVTALVVETSMYMLYLVSQCASLYFLTKRNVASPKASRITPIFVVSLLLFGLTTFQWSFTISTSLRFFKTTRLSFRDATDGAESGTSTILTIPLVIYIPQAVLGDGFFTYRLYIVWGRSRSVLVPPALLIGGFVAFGVLAILGNPFPVIYFMFGSTAILNVFISTMITYKAWKMDMGAQSVGGPLSVTARVAHTLLESAGIYALFVVITAIAGMLSFDVFSACLSALGPIVGISFCVIIVLVGLGRTTDTQDTKEILSAIAFQHSRSTRTSQHDSETRQTMNQEDPFQGSLISSRPPSGVSRPVYI